MRGAAAAAIETDRAKDLDDLEDIAGRLAHRYREVRRTVDASGTLFARHELQTALIEVRRLRRGLAAVEAELEAELQAELAAGLGVGPVLRLVATQPGRSGDRPLRVARSVHPE